MNHNTQTDNIKVSIIIPIYNGEQFLRECLNSVINQDLKDTEIILIDDGSTDSSLSICQEYAKQDNRITVQTQQNKGSGAARNKGLVLARGKYLSFLDADDFFKPNLLTRLYETAEALNNDIVICDMWHYNNNTKKIEDIKETINKEYIPQKEVFNYKDFPEHIFNCFQNWAWNKLFNTQFIKENNIKFQELKRTNDLYFTNCALILANRISFIDEKLIYYRYGTDNSAQSTNQVAPTDFAKAFIKLKDFLEKNKIYETVKQSYINWALSGCLYNIYKLSNYPKTQKRLLNYLVSKGLSQMDITKENKNLIFEKSKYEELNKICSSTINYKNIFQRIFSIKHTISHKTITILGLRIKVKLHKGV